MGAPLGTICALDLATESWSELTLPAQPRPVEVLAASYSVIDDALYVLDRVPRLGSAPDDSCVRTDVGASSYWSCSDNRAWTEARDRCGAVGMILAEIGDASENAVLNGLLPGDGWIGGNDLDVEGDWAWSRGTRFWTGDENGGDDNFSNWAPGQPNDFGGGSGQDCARMRTADGTWQDNDCSASAPYVCEGSFAPDPGEAFASLAAHEAPGLTCGGAQGLQWAMRGGCGDRSGLSDFVGPQASTLQWAPDLGSGIKSSPAIGADGTIYVGNRSRELLAVAPDGTIRWSFTTGGDIDSSPALGADGRIYVGSDDDKLYALEADTGSFVWAYETGDDIDSSPVIGADGTIYVGSDDHRVYAIAPSGSLRWSYWTGNDVDSSPALGPDGTVYIGSDDDHLYALRPDEGLTASERLRWRVDLDRDVDTVPLVAPDGFIYVGSDSDRLYKVDAVTGTVEWTFKADDDVDSSAALLPDGSVVFGDDDGNVWALAPDKTVRWSRDLGLQVDSSPTVGADGTIYVGSDSNKVYALSPVDGSVLWSRDTDGDVKSTPAIAESGVLYVGSDGGELYAIGSPVDPAVFPERIRLLRVDALGGGAEVVRSWVRRSPNDRFALAVDDSGDVFVAASRDQHGWHYVVHLQRQADRELLIAGYRLGAGSLLDAVIQADLRGVSVPTVRSDGVPAIVGYRKSKMTTVRLPQVTPRVF